MTDNRDLSFVPTKNLNPKLLSQDEIARFNEQGYVKPFRIYDDAGAAANREFFNSLMAQLAAADDGRDSYSINGYHKSCGGIYDMVINPLILDHVEDLLGPDFLAWGTHFFCKISHDDRKVPWHQDASYWPLDPSRTITAWLAIDDADEENAAMQFIPGTHRMGHLHWETTRDPAVLNQEIQNVETYGEPVFDMLKAGEMSMHADMLAHGSAANSSDRRRCGLTIRYSPPTVKPLDPGWAEGAIHCRGKDETGNWKYIERPENEALTKTSRG